MQEQFYFPSILSMGVPRIVVTGAGGQLGNEFRELAAGYPQFEFLFTTKAELAVTDKAAVEAYFLQMKPAWCINCAAYTAVDKAETEKDQAFEVNANAVGHLAKTSLENDTRLIHISTDYVFDGSSATPYRENDPTNPVGIYGLSKLKGEALALLRNPKSLIIRTAWVYSSYGHNFVKTMMRLMTERKEISVVNDQRGSPTYAADLAKAIMHVIQSKKWQHGIYHYANTGNITWFEFATAIKELLNSSCKIKHVTTAEYHTKAKRPAFSLLDTARIRQTFDLEIPDWRDSLKLAVAKMQQNNRTD